MEDSVAILLPNENWNNRSISSTRDRKPIIILSIQTVLIFIYTIFTFSFDFIIDVKSKNPLIKASSSSTVIYFSHLAIRLLCLVFKLYLDRNYHRELKLYGYHSHYKRTTFLSELTHLLFNKITILLLLNSSIYQVLTTESDSVIYLFGSDLTITQTQVAKIITIVISVMITIISGKALHLEIDFQRMNHPPDTITDSELIEARQPNDIGLRSSNLTDELLEKQYEMIVNLKSQNDHLRELLAELHDQQNRLNTSQAQNEE